MKSDLQRDQAVLAQIHRVIDPLLLKVPEMDLATVFQMTDLLEVETRHEGVRRRPFTRDHDVVARLVPEVIVELHPAQVVLPAPDDLEVLIQMEKPAGGLALGVAEHRDDDVGTQAMHRMRRGEVGPLLDLGARDHLVQSGIPGIGRAVHDMQVGAAHARQDQIAPLFGGIVMTGRTGVPSHVVQLVADARHLQPADDLGVGGACRIGVDRGQIVWLLDAGADVERNRVKQLFARRLHRLGRRGIAWTAARGTAVSGHVFPPLKRLVVEV